MSKPTAKVLIDGVLLLLIAVASFKFGQIFERRKWTNIPHGACIEGQMMWRDEGRGKDLFVCSKINTWTTTIPGGSR